VTCFGFLNFLNGESEMTQSTKMSEACLIPYQSMFQERRLLNTCLKVEDPNTCYQNLKVQMTKAQAGHNRHKTAALTSLS